MFGHSKPVVFKPVSYSRKREPFRIPKWLMLLLFGIASGVGGLWYAQESLLPKRLSFSESTKLQADLDAAIIEKQKFATELKSSIQRMETAEESSKRAASELAVSKKTTAQLQKDLSQFVLALPPDPRGGPVGIRAASFSASNGQLAYNVVFTRATKTTDTFRGVMQLVVTGAQASGGQNVTALAPIGMALDSYEQLSGSLAIPANVTPKEITVKVLRGPGGDLVSMRVYRL
jgi:hypothetical protein